MTHGKSMTGKRSPPVWFSLRFAFPNLPVAAETFGSDQSLFAFVSRLLTAASSTCQNPPIVVNRLRLRIITLHWEF